jgi:predicted AAA+ superfamily ATPase
LLGSASLDLVHRSSESLAGRIEFIDMGGFTLQETGPRSHGLLWLRGGFPRSFLARSAADSRAWRENFIRTFLQRDLPQLGIRIPAMQLLRFWRMVAHLHGQAWNGSEIAGSLSITHPTARHYLDLLTGAFMLRQLPPWHENAGKRVVKAPKVYLRDSGLLHALLGLWSWPELGSHPKYGFSWEGFAMEQLLRQGGESDAYFWGTHAGAELDLLLLRRGRRWGFEFKLSDAPHITRSMRIAQKDLRLDHLWVVCPGPRGYPMDRGIDCVTLPEALRLPALR